MHVSICMCMHAYEHIYMHMYVCILHIIFKAHIFPSSKFAKKPGGGTVLPDWDLYLGGSIWVSSASESDSEERRAEEEEEEDADGVNFVLLCSLDELLLLSLSLFLFFLTETDLVIFWSCCCCCGGGCRGWGREERWLLTDSQKEDEYKVSSERSNSRLRSSARISARLRGRELSSIGSTPKSPRAAFASQVLW